MPITRPDRSTSAPPELPGLIAALVWMTDERVMPLPSGTLRRTAETMPSVTLERSPSGFPRASTMSPTATCDESANVAARGLAPAMRITARSLAASRPMAVAGWLSPDASVTTKRVAFPTTCALVTTSPRASKTTPEPRSCGVRILHHRRRDGPHDTHEVLLQRGRPIGGGERRNTRHTHRP